MTTILIATSPDEVRSLLPWAHRMATTRGSELQILLPRRKKGETRLVAIESDDGEESELIASTRQTIGDFLATFTESGSAAADEDRPDIPLMQLVGDDWTSRLASHLTELHPSLVIVQAPTISKDQNETDDWQTLLLAGIDCEVILLRDDKSAFVDAIRVAVLLPDGGGHERSLQLAAQLAGDSGQGTAVYREPVVGDFALAVGLRQLDNLLKAALTQSERNVFDRRVIVSNSESETIRQLEAADFDLILTEASDLRSMRRFLSAGLTPPRFPPSQSSVEPNRSAIGSGTKRAAGCVPLSHSSNAKNACAWCHAFKAVRNGTLILFSSSVWPH